MRRDHCVLVLIILLAIMAWLLNDAHAHEIHLDDLRIGSIVQGSFDGKQFKTDDGKCWELYKSPHDDATQMLSSDSKLHIREVTCNVDSNSD